jgi:3-deoxy-D-manno-octulosonic-acid transferase
VDGRSNLKDQLDGFSEEGPLIWFHCASLGEFEQGKPVMEAYKKRHPDWTLLVTFFSPSGYEVRKDCEVADFVMYLPTESRRNIKLFLTTFNPRIAVFVKYEFWYDYMTALTERKVPMIFISASFRKNQIFFKAYGRWFLNQLRNVEMFFVQDKNSRDLLFEKGINKVEISGDTRFDRVLETANSSEDLPWLAEFKDGYQVLIFGSAWSTETEFAIQIVQNLPAGWKVIFAPHEIHGDKIIEFKNTIKEASVLYTDLNLQNAVESKVLIVNTVGHLARMYKYADIAIIGGGFDDGIHNILEPLTFGVPVFFGPNHDGFHEAEAAISNEIGFEIKSWEELKKNIYPLFNSKEKLEEIQSNSIRFIEDGTGATNIIAQFLNKIGQIISCQIC